MSVQLTELISTVRRDSGLKGNPLYSDPDIADILTDGKSQLRDIFIDSFAHWFLDTYDFTLAGGVGGNTLDLTNIPDLQMDQYLNRNPDSATPEPVLRLGSLAERAQFNGLAPAGISGAVGARRRYDTDGDILTVLPIGLSAGNYRLFYTPFDVPFALPVLVRTVTADAFDTPLPSVGPDLLPGWSMANGNFTSEDVGRVFTPALEDPNLVWNVPFTITAVISSTVVNVTPDPSALGSFTLPSVGSYTITGQPPNTRNDLPNVLTPWKLFLTEFACAEVCKGRKDREGFSMHMTTFQIQEKRAIKMSKTRSEGVRQAPMIHSRMRRRGWSYDAP